MLIVTLTKKAVLIKTGSSIDKVKGVGRKFVGTQPKDCPTLPGHCGGLLYIGDN